ncbi:MAG TPA: hypothetical protein VK904_00555 [Miltoncostaeaceae bacterium]|nr:hypothetical protein [Miltoncostaeaceae bacterium]
MSDEGELSVGERIPEVAHAWRELSEMVQRARATPVPAALNETLEHQRRSDPDGPLAAPMLLWMGDSLAMERRFAEACEAYEKLAEGFADRRFGETDWGSMALDRIADCLSRLGRTEEAGAALERLLAAGARGMSQAGLKHRAGRLAEGAGRDDEAAAWYKRARATKDEPRGAQLDVPDLARRDLERLRADRTWMRAEPEDLARELAAALTARRSKALQALEALASPSHFSIAVLNGERAFVDRDALLRLISEDLAPARIRADPEDLEGTGGKRYLATDGWAGRFVTGRLVLLLARTPWGWEWSGVALTQFPDADWEPLVGPSATVTNQPLTLAIKAPWSAGLAMRAGGILPFAAELAFCMSFGPFAPLCMAARSLGPCGFGPGGLYFGGVGGVNFTHGGDDFFAIDFARFLPGAPFANVTFGTPVRSVQAGMVSGVRGLFPTGSTVDDNRVLVKHMTEAEFIMIVIVEILSGAALRPFATPRFTSMYLHLDGPGRIPVSPGMFVRQGAFLGPADDTGNSAGHHLHFSIHDRTLPASSPEGTFTPAGRSVRPTPMDGQRLIEIDDGRCVVSTNA